MKIKEIIGKLVSSPYFWIVVILLTPFIIWVSATDILELMTDKNNLEMLEIHSQIARNRGWLLWMIISLIGLTGGLYFTYWGRKTQEQQWQTQRESHLHERLEKATTMLGNESMAVRITGCRLLMSLGIDEENMKSLCVHLLFAFINNPYLKSEHEGKNLNRIFSKSEPLRSDIQEAADSFSSIYEYYGDEEIDDKPVQLPIYFWNNNKKNKIFLAKANLNYANLREANLIVANFQGANLSGANLQEANLIAANLQGANLYKANLRKVNLNYANLQKANLYKANLQEANLMTANLQGANLSGANLQEASFNYSNLGKANFQGADITDAKMHLVENLTKEQILSAKWTLGRDEKGIPPLLPKEFDNISEVQEWVEFWYLKNREKSG